jgi:hypothetical protein
MPHDKPQFALVMFNTTGEASTAGALPNRMRARHATAAQVRDLLAKRIFDLSSGLSHTNSDDSPLQYPWHSDGQSLNHSAALVTA